MPPLSPTPPHAASSAPLRKPLAVWLGGTIGWDDYVAMAERLAGEVTDSAGRNPTLVVCELAPGITIGRAGSRADVRLSDDEIRGHRLGVTFTGRGGGAVLHGPGQVTVALFAPLVDLGFAANDVGGYVAAFEAAIARAIRTVRCGATTHPGVHGVFGRRGLLAALGIAVRRGVACHGASVNVSPPLDLHQRIDTLPARLLGDLPGGTLPATMGSIEADVQRRVRLQDVRTAVVESLADAFAVPRIHMNAGFPYRLHPATPNQPEVVSRVG
jgi:lipoyl(octanoyl) transferase